jgi:hypothetical protein
MFIEELKQKRMVLADNCCLDVNVKATNVSATLSLKTKTGCIISSLETRDSEWNAVTRLRQHQRSLRPHLLM